MQTNFQGKTVVITGGSRGIGSAMVDAFLKAGAMVYTTGTDQEALDELNALAKRNSQRVEYLHLDFTSSDSVNACLETLNKSERIDVLVNNAGVNKINPVDKVLKEDWDWLNEVNLRGPFLMTRALAPKMKAQGSGRIINISSIFGVVSKEKRSVYSATKWGLVGFTKAVALDLAPHNILVNAVSPGFVDTELTREILGEAGMKELEARIPLQRVAVSGEIANVVLFLASEHNTYITGQNIIIDGGFTSA